MSEFNGVQFTHEEWPPAANAIDLMRQIAHELKHGLYRGAIDADTQAGQKLRQRLTELVETVDKVPVPVIAESL